MNKTLLLRRLRLLTWIFIVGLLVSGVTAIPLRPEVSWIARHFGATDSENWLIRVSDALNGTATRYPFLFYGTDWLAFGHFMIAVAFVGVLRDPVRNRWLFDFGLIACALVIPFAFIFGGIRGIPIWWRLIDCSFGVFGAVPLWLCRKWALELEKAGDS